jgi:hypothetical protein
VTEFMKSGTKDPEKRVFGAYIVVFDLEKSLIGPSCGPNSELC